MGLVTSCLLRERALEHGDAPALLWMKEGRLHQQTYATLDANIAHVARQLDGDICRASGRGSAAGLRVGLLIDDAALCLRLSWALFRLGADVVFLSTRLPVAALVAQCDAASCSVVVTDRQRAFQGDGPLEIYMRDYSTDVGASTVDGKSDRFHRARTVLFTSGSSGRPRGVQHNIHAHVRSALGSNTNIRLNEGDRWLLALPQYHVSGLSVAFRCFAAGAAVAVAPSQALLESARLMGATHLSAVSTQLRRLISAAEDARETLAGLHILVGGGPVPVGLSRKAVSLGARVYVSFGMSEMASQITTTDGTGTIAELSTSGRPLPYRKVRIADRDTHGSGDNADSGSAGLIEVGGETLFDGYLGTDDPGPVDGWFATGDIGSLDEEGRLTIKGRADRMFISGGENIHPEEIERLILQQTGIQRAAVVPVSDPDFGERPVAFVDPMPGQEAIAVINDTLSERLPRYALPVGYYPFQSDAETSISKLDYRKLASWAERVGKHSR